MWCGLAWRFSASRLRIALGVLCRSCTAASPMASLTVSSPYCETVILEYREASSRTTSSKYKRCDAYLTDEGTSRLQIKSSAVLETTRRPNRSLRFFFLRTSPRPAWCQASRTRDARVTTLCTHANEEARLLQRLGELSMVMILSGFHGCEQAKARLKRAGHELVQTATLGC